MYRGHLFYKETGELIITYNYSREPENPILIWLKTNFLCEMTEQNSTRTDDLEFTWSVDGDVLLRETRNYIDQPSVLTQEDLVNNGVLQYGITVSIVLT